AAPLRKYREATSAGADGVVEFKQPPRPLRQRWLRVFTLDVASTPPWKGGESAQFKHSRLCATALSRGYILPRYAAENRTGTDRQAGRYASAIPPAALQPSRAFPKSACRLRFRVPKV